MITACVFMCVMLYVLHVCLCVMLYVLHVCLCVLCCMYCMWAPGRVASWLINGYSILNKIVNSQFNSQFKNLTFHGVYVFRSGECLALGA